MVDETRYNLAQFMFNDTKITTDSFSTTRKQDINERTCTDSHNAYDIEIGKETFEWDMSDIAPYHRRYFEEIMDKQKTNPNELGLIATYDYNENTGDLKEDDVYYGVYVTEISKDKANQPFSVKGGALRKKNRQYY